MQKKCVEGEVQLNLAMDEKVWHTTEPIQVKHSKNLDSELLKQDITWYVRDISSYTVQNLIPTQCWRIAIGLQVQRQDEKMFDAEILKEF